MGSGLQMVLHVPFYFGPRMDRGGQRQEKEGKDSEDRAANRTGRWAGWQGDWCADVKKISSQNNGW